MANPMDWSPYLAKITYSLMVDPIGQSPYLAK